MARMATTRRVAISTIGAWFFGFLIFFPILWMMLASFKTELEAFAIPPSFLFFHWTTENYAAVQERSDYLHHAIKEIPKDILEAARMDGATVGRELIDVLTP